MKLSDFIGKDVIAVYEGKIIGKVGGAVLSESRRRIAYLSVTGEDGCFSLPISRAYGAEDAVTVRNADVLGKCPAGGDPIGKDCYTVYGKRIGILSDITVSVTGAITGFVTEKETFDAKRCVSFGDLAVFKEDDAARKFSPKRVPLPKADYAVKLEAPQHYGFLRNKVAARTLYDKNNAEIIRKNGIITDRTIAIAVSCGKLIELIACAR